MQLHSEYISITYLSINNTEEIITAWNTVNLNVPEIEIIGRFCLILLEKMQFPFF